MATVAMGKTIVDPDALLMRLLHPSRMLLVERKLTSFREVYRTTSTWGHFRGLSDIAPLFAVSAAVWYDSPQQGS